ncbi:hypothetical protein [Pseudomonas chlororaphis]|uniref:hypothetical protein n=1 Tax=Pseudomonas chlororaphis TaxID=587753 RepID=UPI000F58E4C1|nr:hypothetical protein [Pseudomonas chlororaphis]QQX62166.1 hypothetical protein JHW28_12930 [Pseudomonas chlororaphis subsp. aurantiaca]UVE48870.1 hypothetical protein KS461_13345 [Pseudomonas chlororaphis]
MQTTLLIEEQGAQEVGGNVRGALWTTGENAGHIKQGLARLKKLDIGQVQHLCQGCRNPTPPKRAGELILASDEQTFFCDLL